MTKVSKGGWKEIPGRRISVARSRLRERRAIKRGFPSTSADGPGDVQLAQASNDVRASNPSFSRPATDDQGVVRVSKVL